MNQKPKCETRNTGRARRKHGQHSQDIGAGKTFLNRTLSAYYLMPTIDPGSILSTQMAAHNHLQPCINPGQGNLKPSSHLCGHQTHTWCRNTHLRERSLKK